jgi:hypothetical protein
VETINVHQSSVQVLEQENRKLRDLLAVVGVHPTCVDAFVKGGDPNHLQPSFSATLRVPAPDVPNAPVIRFPSTNRDKDITNNEMNEAKNWIKNQGAVFSVEHPMTSLPLEEPVLPHLESVHLWNTWETMSLSPNFSSGGFSVPYIQESPPPPGRLCCASLPDTMAIQEIEETTLCSVAFQLVHQFNAKGSDVIEIGLRLWRGFRKESAIGEGCRVDSKMLLEVLSDISKV